MFIVILFILLGIIAGRAMRKRRLEWLPRATTGLVWALLFLMGIEVGSNEHIITTLPTLGAEALCLSAMATTGSAVGAWLLWKHIGKKGGTKL